MKGRPKAVLVGVAALAVIAVNPVIAAGVGGLVAKQPRQASAPSYATVAYNAEIEQGWRCAEITDPALQLEKAFVRLDASSRVVIDTMGNSFPCQ